MAQSQIIDGTTFDSSKIRYTSPKVNQSGGKSVGILSTMTNTALKIQTPSMITWGLSDYEGNEKYDVSLQFPTEEYDNDELRAFRQNMVEFENKIKADALTNSKLWFGKQHTSPEVLEALWTPILKYTKDKATGEPDKTKAPTLRVKVPYYEQVWKVEVYDEKCERLFPNEDDETPVELIKKGMRIVTLMQCGGLWFVSGKFGVTWKLVQAVVPRENDSKAGCLIRMKSTPQEAPQAHEQLREASVTNVEASATVVEDSDDEAETTGENVEESASQDETISLTQTTEKKRVVRRKKE